MLVHLALLTPIASVCVFERPPEGTGALHWLDLDRDGDVDLLAIAEDGSLRFLRQESARRFVDVSIAAGLDALRGVRALVAADLDGDGLPELVVGCEDGARVLRQTKGGAFEERTEDCGLEGVGEVRALERIDLDGDGGVDLVVSGPSGRRFFHDRGDLRFEPLEIGAASSFSSVLAPNAIDGIEVLAKEVSVPAAASDASSSAARPPIADASAAAPSASATGAPAATLGLAGCIKSISDQAAPGSCLEASSIPELGLLYPLSPELNVDAATGFVGIHTTSADTRLHVVGQGRFQGGSEASTSPGSGMLQVLSFDALSGIGIDSNELQVWGAELSINPQGSFGTRINESLFVQPGELVGIGKQPSLGIALDVDGVVRADDTIVSTKPAGAPFLIASQDLSANLNADLLDGLHASAFSQLGSSIETSELADAAVTGPKLAAGAVDDARVASGAAIAGTKIAPNFGAQDVVTTGRVAIGTTTLGEQLTVAGVIESTDGGIRFPDGSLQATAQLVGPEGPAGPPGPQGPPGPPGPTEPPEPTGVLGTWGFSIGGQSFQGRNVFAYEQRNFFTTEWALPPVPMVVLTVELDDSTPILHHALRAGPPSGDQFTVTLDVLGNPARPNAVLTLAGEDFAVVQLSSREHPAGSRPRLDVGLVSTLTFTFDDGQGATQQGVFVVADFAQGGIQPWPVAPYPLDPQQYRVYGLPVPGGTQFAPGFGVAFGSRVEATSWDSPSSPYLILEIEKPLGLDTVALMSRGWLGENYPTGAPDTYALGIEYVNQDLVTARYDFAAGFISSWRIETRGGRIVEVVEFSDLSPDINDVTTGGSSSSW